MRLFIHEHLCAGGLGPDAPASLWREGWAMLRAVAADFARLPGVHVTTLVAARCPEPPGHACQRTGGDEPKRFRACAACADATLVIAPEFDDCLLERSRWVLEAGGRLLGSLPAGVALTADKWALAQFWHARGVRTPATALASAMPPELPSPWVCKPRHGAGSQATFLVPDAAAWPGVQAQACAAWPCGDLLAQRFVPGLAASCVFLLGPGQCVALPPATQDLSSDGRLQYHGCRVPLPAGLRERAVGLGRLALAGIAGLQGYVGVDLVLGAAADGSEDYAIEINPRLTTSYLGLRRLCQGNLAHAWLQVLAGIGPELSWHERVVHISTALLD